MAFLHIPAYLTAVGHKEVLDYGFWGATLEAQTQSLSSYMDTRPDVDSVHVVIYDSRAG